MKGITELGWGSPSPIQAESMGFLLDGRDVIGQAQTGTGKTAAFGIPMIELIDPHLKYVQGLILAPTRELAVQISEHLSQLAKYREVKILAVYGGDSMQLQTKVLKQGVHIIVGTPGRILDHISKGSMNLRKVRFLVLDEADRMLDMGFIEDIRNILSITPNDMQVGLFSATLNRSVMQICKDFMHYPEKVIVSKDEIALPQIEQHYVEVESNSKFRVLLSILEEFRIKRAIIFSRTQDSATSIAKALIDRGYDAAALHGGLSQLQRDRITEFFRDGKLRLLIATDIASRGLDIRDVTHIINFNIPTDPAVYFHRIGRTARMDAGGTAISLMSSEELKDLDRIRGMTSTQITVLHGKHEGIVDVLKEPRPKCAKCGNEFTPTFTLTEGVFVYCTKCYKNHQKKKRQNRQIDAN